MKQRRISLLLILLVICVVALAQDGTVTAVVVDGRTGEALPFATVAVNGRNVTITNSEGTFAAKADSGDVVSVSYIGYASKSISASSMGGIVRLEPMKNVLREVTVRPIAAIVEDVRRNIVKRESRKRRQRSNFLYRQTAYRNGQCTSLSEVFFETKSATKVSDMRLIAKRFLAIDGEAEDEFSFPSNFYALSDIPYYSNEGAKKRNRRICPLMKGFESYFDVGLDVIGDGNTLLYVLDFSPKQNVAQDVLACRITVEAATMNVLRVEGRWKNLKVIHLYDREDRTTVPTTVRFDMTFENATDTAKVQSVYVEASYDVDGDSCSFHSLLYNVGQREVRHSVAAWKVIDLRRMTATLDEKMYRESNEIVKLAAAENSLLAAHENNLEGKGCGTSNQLLQRFVRNINRFNRLWPQEKVYLHFDNTSYFRGETIWFKAYIIRNDSRTLTDLSRVLYVELLDPSGNVVDTKKLYIDNGQADGAFSLSDLLVSGYYEVRAYTKYMLNWGDDAVFSRVLPVFEEPKRRGNYSKKVIQHFDYSKRLPNIRQIDTHPKGALDVRFYPEGGRLIKGIESCVAFDVVDENSQSFNTQGVLEYPDGNAVEVKTVSEGRGSFMYLPTDQPAVLVLKDKRGENKSLTLPATDTVGCAMRVDVTNSASINVTIKHRGLMDNTVGFLVVNGGNVKMFDTLSLDKPVVNVLLRRADMTDGVSQLIVIDQEGTILAERMVFVNNNDVERRIVFDASNQKIAPCGKITMKATTTPNSTFSVSVRDGNNVMNGSDLNAATWLLLSSDLKGYIRHPEYYLSQEDEEHRRATDLLMMVQGWRSYDISQMCYSDTFSMKHPIEDGLYLSGKLKQTKNSISVDGVKLRADFYNSEGMSLTGTATTAHDGRYKFRLPDCEGEWTLLMNTRKNDEATNYLITIDRNFSPMPRSFSPYETKPIESLATKLAVPLIYDFDSKSDSIQNNAYTISEIKVKGHRRYKDAREAWESEQRGKYFSNIRYNCTNAVDDMADKGETVPYLYDWLIRINPFITGEKHMEILHSQTSTEKGENATTESNSLTENENLGLTKNAASEFSFSEDGLGYKNRPVVWILNNAYKATTNLPHSLAEKILKNSYIKENTLEEMPIWLDEVKSVFISEDERAWTKYLVCDDLAGYHPVTIFVYTYHSFPKRIKGLRRTHYEGFSKKETFQSPDYSLMTPMPDFRRTLYWNPNVKTDSHGNATIEFYNNSTCTQFSVSAEAITEDGQALVFSD